ncbi:MAG: hypothetical protein L0287_01660 [Anaerolineae bacterium]|nr:hypothetical protein [Anaerolineae bacterium]
MFGLGQDVLSNIIATIFIAVSGWILSVILRIPFIYHKRRKLFSFFNISKENPTLTAYLSTVFVQSGGSVDFRGVARTFRGAATPSAELSTIEPIVKLFDDANLDSLPSTIRDWLGNKVHWSFHKVKPVFITSPQDKNQVAQGNIFTVGSQYYNSIADFFSETNEPILKIESGVIIRVNKGQRIGDVFEQRKGQSDDLAVVEKLYDKANNRVVFFAAGLGVVGTLGAVNYVINNWSKLEKEYKTEPFAVCLRFQNVLHDPHAYKKPIELSWFR